LLACPECGAHPLDLTILETGTSPAPSGPTPHCSSYCSLRSEAWSEESEYPCAGCYTQEVLHAILHCDRCRCDFPVIDGIPRFNPDAGADYPEFFRRNGSRFRYKAPSGQAVFEQLHAGTKRSFGFQWLRYRVTDHQENRGHFYRRTGTVPGQLRGQLLFEAGCGMGRYLKVVAEEPGAEVVGLDLSLAVNRAAEENRNSPFVHVVQGNLLQPPLRPAAFDHVYSIGVLHHTPDTKRAFLSILKLLKPGGRISVWVYHVWRPPELRGWKAAHATLKGVFADGLRRITTRLPLRLLHYLCYLAVPIGWLQRRIQGLPPLLRALCSPILLIACSTHPQWRVRLLDTFDWYSPRYQWKHTVAEVAGWFREAGLIDVDTQGFPVSVRGTRPPPG
jgi:SAM-dependent methyltransferase